MNATSLRSSRVSLNINLTTCRNWGREASGTWDLLAMMRPGSEDKCHAMEQAAKWFLKKHEDGEVFGPVVFAQLKEWSCAAQVSPLDQVSDDCAHWIKATMVPELHMDYLIHLGGDLLYGPTTEQAVREFLRLGEVQPESMLINCCTGAEMTLRAAGFCPVQPPPPEATALSAPGRHSIRQNLQQRIRELELLLVERNQQLDRAGVRIRQLERRLPEAGLRAG
jgi:hypothetical protein